MASHEPAGFLEYKHRVLYSLYRAVARLGVRSNVPLDQMVELLQMAYFREAREHRRLKLTTIAELFDKSLRTVNSLQRRYRGDFFVPERDVQFRRDVAEFLTDGPKSREDLVAAFPHRSAVELAAALDDLEQEGRIIQSDGRYRREPADHDFYDEADIASRITGLNRQMDILAETVWHRLLRKGSKAPSGGRSYVFAAVPERFQELLNELFERVRTEILDEESQAFEQGHHTRHAITIAGAALEEPE